MSKIYQITPYQVIRHVQRSEIFTNRDVSTSSQHDVLNILRCFGYYISSTRDCKLFIIK